jgi:hypothetical protein
VKINSNFILLIILLLCSSSSLGREWNKAVNLNGFWKFSIGDNIEWAEKGYNDSDWEEIKVPSSWEEQGFHGYDGYAWYRVSFKISAGLKGKNLFLFLGNVDDADQTFLNGKLIGLSGSFPPGYQTAYNVYRQYPIPEELINFGGTNTIAVRVFDAQLSGGILRGDIGVFVRENTLVPDLSLEGNWKFSIGDDPKRKEKNFDDGKWGNIIVPGFWETQGYADYDGFAWYRKTFKLPAKLKNEKIVLMMGRIDDIDEVYVNGILIGSTGTMHDDPFYIDHGNNEWESFRGYYIPDNILKSDGENVIAVRVYDGFMNGGIYQGPVGLIIQKKYAQFWHERRKGKNIFERIFGN